MYQRLGHWVTRHWLATLIGWALLTLFLSRVAPKWDQITQDGDFAYLPARVSSVKADHLLEEAFDQERAKSQIAVIVFRSDGPLTEVDLAHVAYDLARRIHNAFGVVAVSKTQRLAEQISTLRKQEDVEEIDVERLEEQRAQWLARAESSLDEAILLDSLLEYDRPATGPGSRWAEPIHNRALLYGLMGRQDEADLDRELAIMLQPTLENETQLMPQVATELPWLDLWTWRDETFGSKLRSEDQRARLMLLQLREEFLALANIELIEFLQGQLAQVRQTAAQHPHLSHLQIGLSGSASVGGDLLLSAKASIRHTEWFTVALVVIILIVVYRSPLLVVVPLLTIFVSLRVGICLTAMLTQLDQVPGFAWWELKVFTTSKIFIVVILFGAGTDFCLFLIARCREALSEGKQGVHAVEAAVAGVGQAVSASALTTIIGLGMMYFAEFGKFRYSGPVIGLCLLVTLAACLTLTPALLCMMSSFLQPNPNQGKSRLWKGVAEIVTRQPRRVLLLTTCVLLPFAAWGFHRSDHISYDFLASLSPNSASRQGADLMRASFPIGESGPVMVVAKVLDPVLESRVGRDEVARLNYMIHDITGVVAVRSLADPLGETSRSDSAVLLSRDTIEARFARYHQRTSELFLAQSQNGWAE